MFITVPAICLWHCIEGISEVNVDLIDSLSLSVGFMRDKMHFFACWCWHFDPACPHPALVLTHLFVPRSSSAACWWCNWAVGTHYWTALPVFDQTFCWCCLLCGVERWCHSWWTNSGARCEWFSRVESIFHSPTLARSRIPHLTLSSIAQCGTCLGLAPCLVLDSVQRTLRSLDWWVHHATCAHSVSISLYPLGGWKRWV